MPSLMDSFKKVLGESLESVNEALDVISPFPKEAEEAFAEKVRRAEENMPAWERTLYEGGADYALPVVGLFRGLKGSKSAIDRMKLEEARDFLRAGANPKKTWQQTGYFEGPYDRMIRAEISDELAEINPEVLEELSQQPLFTSLTKSAKDVLVHPEVFERYPELQDMIVEMTPYPTENVMEMVTGRHKPRLSGPGILELDVPVFETPTGRRANPEELISTTLHETQHGIDKIEGFARGGIVAEFEDLVEHPNVPLLRKQMNEVLSGELPVGKELPSGYTRKGRPTRERPELSSLDEARRLEKVIEKIQGFSPGQTYLGTAGEISAREVELRRLLGQKARFEDIMPFEEAAKEYPREEVVTRFYRGRSGKEADDLIKRVEAEKGVIYEGQSDIGHTWTLDDETKSSFTTRGTSPEEIDEATRQLKEAAENAKRRKAEFLAKEAERKIKEAEVKAKASAEVDFEEIEIEMKRDAKGNLTGFKVLKGKK